MPVYPQTLTSRYASVLHCFAQLGYKTPLTLAVRLQQAYANPHLLLDMNLVPVTSGQAPLKVQLQFKEYFLISAISPLTQAELFKLHSLNDMLKMRTPDVVI